MLKNILIFLSISCFLFVAITLSKSLIYSNDESSLIYKNELEIDSVLTRTDLEKKLFEYCKVWGTLKYHQDYKKQFIKSIDSIIISDYYRIHKNDGFTYVMSNLIKKVVSDEVNDEPSQFLNNNNILDKNWIDHSKFIKERDKILLKKYILNSYQSNRKLLIFNEENGTINLDNDSLYTRIKNTNRGIRFLSLCKIWNIIRYYYPYYEDISDNWNNVFFEMLPLFLNSKSDKDYHLAILKMSSKLNDSHVICESKIVNFYYKKYSSMAILKTIQNRTFVKRLFTAKLRSNLKVGDEILSINGNNIKLIRDSIKKYISGSTIETNERQIDQYLLSSNNSKLSLKIIRNNKQTFIFEELNNLETASTLALNEHKSFAGEVVSSIIDKNIGYINIQNIFSGNFRISIEQIKNCKGIIFDMRGYPNEVGCEFLKYFDCLPFQQMNLYSADSRLPGFMKTVKNEMIMPVSKSDAYKRPVIILTNEYTQSQAESIVFYMKNIKNSLIIGDYTAGTNGNVTELYLPGMSVMQFSGLGVLNSNFTKIQRKGISPQILVKESINDIKSNKDTQLNYAIQLLNKNS